MKTRTDSLIELDGAQGEGGGQILRTALSLAMLQGRPLRLHNIRAGRRKPGLMRQHLVCVRAAATVSSATVDGADIGSTALEFRPAAIRGGHFDFRIGSAGSTMLVLQTVLPALLRADTRASSRSKAAHTIRWRRRATSSNARSCRCSRAWARRSR